MQKDQITAISIIVGTCIGSGFLGIPYIAAQLGFFPTMLYLIIFGSIILTLNLYFGEVILRTRQQNHLIGYTQRYLGNRYSMLMKAAVILSVYAALLSYMIGIGESVSHLITGTTSYSLAFGIIFGIVMSIVLLGGLKSLKYLEKVGVASIILLFIAAFATYITQIDLTNLIHFDSRHIFLPIGVILFSLIEFYSLPEARMVLKGKEHLLKRTIIIGTITPIIFYIIFAFIVVGFRGQDTPQISTFALGNIFVLVGMFAMFTSYLALATAIIDNYKLDLKLSNRKAWALGALPPILVYIVLSLGGFLDFIGVLSIGGVIAGGTMVILVLMKIHQAEVKGTRKPEYDIKTNKYLTAFFIIIFLLAMAIEIGSRLFSF